MPPVPNVRGLLQQSTIANTINAELKGRLQQASSTTTQWRYELEALIRCTAVPSGRELQAALARRIAARRAGRRPARKGDLRIFLAFGLTNWESVLPRALSIFGHVETFEWRSRGWNDLAADWLSRRDAMNEDMLRAFDEAHREQPIDAFVGYLSGHNMSPEALRAVAKRGAVVFNFCWDDKLNFPGPKEGGRHRSPAGIAAAVDLNLTNAPGSVVRYAAHGGLAMFFPEAAYPEVHRPHNVSFDIDVSFIGARYGWRPHFMRALERLGVRVECFGRGWPNGPLDDTAAIRLFSRSRINLGFSNIGYSRTLMCLKGRDFEIPMSGGLYLTQHNPELGQVFDLGAEIVTYRDEHDCARQIRRLLAEPALAERIRLAGRERALREHTYERRWTDIFALAGLLEGTDFERAAPSAHS